MLKVSNPIPTSSLRVQTLPALPLGSLNLLLIILSQKDRRGKRLPGTSAILLLNRSSFAEGLLTEAERARFGSKPRPSPIQDGSSQPFRWMFKTSLRPPQSLSLRAKRSNLQRLLLSHRHSERPKGAQRLKGVEESLCRGHSCHHKRRFLDFLRPCSGQAAALARNDMSRGSLSSNLQGIIAVYGGDCFVAEFILSLPALSPVEGSKGSSQ